MGLIGLARRLHAKPVETVPWQREEVAQLTDGRERDPAHALDRGVAVEPAQVELHRLREPRQIVHAQDRVTFGAGRPGIGGLPDEREHARTPTGHLVVLAEPADGIAPEALS